MDEAKKDKLLAVARVVIEDKARLEQALKFVAQGMRVCVMTLDCDGKGCNARHTYSVPIEEDDFRNAMAMARREARSKGWRCVDADDVDTCPVCRDEMN